MNRRSFLLKPAAALTLAASTMLPAWAQTPAMVAAEVTKVDKAGGRVTLKHGEIKSLDMPAMTMVWRVAAPRMLDEVEAGDRVRFIPERINGQYTVTSLVKAPQ